MKQVSLSVLLLICLSSCASLEPHVYNRKDLFTNVRTRTMVVGESSTSVLLASLATSPSAAQARSLTQSNQVITLGVGPSDTTMTFVRLFPERNYYVPEEARLLIRFFGTKQAEGDVISLPLRRGYHTTDGSLIVLAKVNADALGMLQRETIDAIRVDLVSINESDQLPIDWRLPVQYANAFQKGALLLFEQRVIRESKGVNAEKPVINKKKK